MAADEQPHEIGLRTNGRAFSFSGGPAYLLVGAVFIIGILWVTGEYILPKTTQGQDLTQLTAQITGAVENQRSILKELQRMQDHLTQTQFIRARLEQQLNHIDRDLARGIAQMLNRCGTMPAHEHKPAPRPPFALFPPRHHSE